MLRKAGNFLRYLFGILMMLAGAAFHKRPLFFSSYIFYLRTARRYTTRETAAEMTSVIQKACHTKTPPPRWDSR